jgi:hypothetical protein
LNRGDAVGGLEVIGPPSMADAAPAPRAHAPVAPANQFHLFSKCRPPRAPNAAVEFTELRHVQLAAHH